MTMISLLLPVLLVLLQQQQTVRSHPEQPQQAQAHQPLPQPQLQLPRRRVLQKECPFTSERGITLCTTTCASVVDWDNKNPTSLACEAEMATLCAETEFYNNNVDGCTNYCCNECIEKRYLGCEACVSSSSSSGGSNNNCLWCGQDALCISPETLIPTNSLSCGPNDFVNTCSSPTENDNNVFADDLYDAMQWVYKMISVEEVWSSGTTGTGIGIRINDNGVDADHSEFNGRFDVSSSCSIYTPVIDGNKEYSHGTTVASLAAGGANNGCAVGIAPTATLSACRAISTFPTDELTPEAPDFSFIAGNMENMHISSNSWQEFPCLYKGGGQRRQRQLQVCPFDPSNFGSPCAPTSSCAGVNWASPDVGPNNNAACEAEIVLYCRSMYEMDVRACTSFLDLFVSCEYNSLTIEQQNAFMDGITEGRDGKGIIYVFSSGNFFQSGSDVNFAGVTNNRYTISVAAVDRKGVHASYSTPGAAVLVTAPGGDFEYFTNNLGALAGGGCTDIGPGTSFSVPIVSGVIALMLEVNPDLTWRDVQGILAETSSKTDPTNPSWTTNAVGLHHSNLYGFGVVNASAAVNAAKSWKSYFPERQIIVDSEELNLVVPDYPGDPVQSSLPVRVNSDTFVVESVAVYLNMNHPSRGDLEVVLTSPGGTESVLHPGERPESSNADERWKLTTVRSWGESPNGDWMIRVTDLSAGDLIETCFDYKDWQTQEFDDGTGQLFAFDCATFHIRSQSCNDDGSIGPDFETFFGGFASGLNDPLFADGNGATPDVACCGCGGGIRTAEFSDSVENWRLVIYGHDPTPTPEPSSFPSAAPVLTAASSSLPSFQPSKVPSEQPTNQPSTLAPAPETTSVEPIPTSQPSKQTTNETNETNTVTPSSLPSLHPSDQPSGQLKKQPTKQPTKEPTKQPTNRPTTQAPVPQPVTVSTNYPTRIIPVIMVGEDKAKNADFSGAFQSHHYVATFCAMGVLLLFLNGI